MICHTNAKAWMFDINWPTSLEVNGQRKIFFYSKKNKRKNKGSKKEKKGEKTPLYLMSYLHRVSLQINTTHLENLKSFILLFVNNSEDTSV